MRNFIVVGLCKKLLRQVLLAIHGFSDAHTITVIGGENTRELRWSSLCSHNIITTFDPGRDGDFIQHINALCGRMSNPVLIPADCEGAKLINRVIGKLHLKTMPITDTSMLEILNDKWRFHEFCVQHALTVPETVFIGSKFNLDFAVIVKKLGLPFVLKPVNQAGSQGVHIIHSENYFHDAIRDNDAYRFDTLIAQRYIPGRDICFSFLAIHGEITALAIQQRIGSEIRFLSDPALERLGHQLARAAAYHGVMNIDARIEEGTQKVFLIESNPRFWASLGASTWCGLNFVAESINAASLGGGTRRLTTGIYHERHPLLRPSSWAGLAFDPSVRGRMWRATMRDLPLIAAIVRSLPAMLWKYASRRISTQRATH